MEPEAKAKFEGSFESVQYDSGLALVSIAISLKRIADAMQSPNEYGEVGGAAIAGAIARSLRDR